MEMYNPQKPVLLDGAMGTMLQAAGLPLGQIPEVWNITEPEKIIQVHRRYVEAGSRVLYTNTFGVNRYKTAFSGFSVAELTSAAVRCARAAAEGCEVLVALDIGPIGQLLEPLGTLPFEEAYQIFREIVTAGTEAGADLIVIETMSDLYEVKAAVLAAKESCSLPVWVTMTFETSGRTFLGTTIPSMALTLEGLGVDAIGFNCSLGPDELLPMIEELRQWTDLPLILKPNAGLPDPATGAYAIGPEEFAEKLSGATALGVSLLGGCCGTSPDFIRSLADRLTCPCEKAQNSCSANDGREEFHVKDVLPNTSVRRRGVCSSSSVAEYGGIRVIGERINPTGKKRFQQALRDNDLDYIIARGIEQQDAGAQILDVNVGLPGINEPEMMVRVIRALQAVVDLPLQIDSSNPAAIEAGLRAVNGKAIVNSVNGDEETLSSILPLCKKYGAAVIGLCMDHRGIPQTWQDRAAIARRILDAALSYGIPKEDVLIDCLTLTISAQQEQAAETLRAVRYVREELGLHTALGVSNISFGLPARETISGSFLTQAMYAGLDFPIINPNQQVMMDAVAAFRALSGEDVSCESYIRRFAGSESGDSPVALHTSSGDTSSMTLQEAILKGLRRETSLLTEKALKSMSGLEVVDTLLIPALDAVGDLYEKQKLFLPQLINAANAACEGFALVRERITAEGTGAVSKGKIVLATVHGDIHDIGKNIVKVVLENYGYTVIDLGRDVPVQTVVDTVLRENISLVGLSALMTTTVSSMAETIHALRESGHPCKIMVGGAVLTPEYAAEIGADYYAADAKQSADIAKLVLG